MLLSSCSSTPVSAPGSTTSGSVPSRGSSPAATTPATKPATTPVTGTIAGTLARLSPLTGAFLAPGSDPHVLPGPVLVADEDNNRLVLIDPRGRTLWEFPRPGDLAPGQTFVRPDDVFFTPDGTQIVATQEEDQVVSVIDIATRHIVYRLSLIHISEPTRLGMISYAV